MDEGWTRWVLEQYEFPYRTLTDKEIRTVTLGVSTSSCSPTRGAIRSSTAIAPARCRGARGRPRREKRHRPQALVENGGGVFAWGRRADSRSPTFASLCATPCGTSSGGLLILARWSASTRALVATRRRHASTRLRSSSRARRSTVIPGAVGRKAAGARRIECVATYARSIPGQRLGAGRQPLRRRTRRRTCACRSARGRSWCSRSARTSAGSRTIPSSSLQSDLCGGHGGVKSRHGHHHSRSGLSW